MYLVCFFADYMAYILEIYICLAIVEWLSTWLMLILFQT
jgi:hypothetical protein